MSHPSYPVQKLQSWFGGLNKTQQKEVLSFIYDEKNIIQKGSYFGPAPGMVQNGLYCGPAPQPDKSKCPTCGKPY